MMMVDLFLSDSQGIRDVAYNRDDGKILGVENPTLCSCSFPERYEPVGAET